MRSLLLAVLLAVATLAPVTAQASDFAAWERSDRRATNVARTGLIISGVGLGMSLGGVGLLVSADEGLDVVGTQLAIIGQLALYLGPPLLAGGSLRARRALNELGAGGPGPFAGTMAWALWGVSLAIPGTVLAATADDPSGVILYGVWAAVAGGAVLAGAMQMQDNARYRANLPGTGAAPAKRSRVFVQVVPAIGPRNTGLRLAGVF
ncbi:MAG: hypothetical protein JRI25_16825 [Deltaproteobacteria bacterium]|nr:hypothetical protein [Deltaproteobacteria bacterium]